MINVDINIIIGKCNYIIETLLYIDILSNRGIVPIVSWTIVIF